MHKASGRSDAGAEAFVRQLAWRDFHHQVLAARPGAARADYRTKGDRWRYDGAEVTAWKEGRTGYPVVDAGMRQLLHEGWLHNRARMLVASFLTKTLYVDWRVGARHFLDLLVDGDVANNQLNWQWVAGTGTDTRPNRVLNPLVQARRFDPEGAYVRRWVPELAGLAGPHGAPAVEAVRARARGVRLPGSGGGPGGRSGAVQAGARAGVSGAPDGRVSWAVAGPGDDAGRTDGEKDGYDMGGSGMRRELDRTLLDRALGAAGPSSRPRCRPGPSAVPRCAVRHCPCGTTM